MVSAIEPVVLLHGAEDDVVPLGQSEAYVAAHHHAELRALPATGHFALVDPTSAAWPEVVEAIRGVARREAVRGASRPT
jgi:pimeloyl-ACP methyl ester carboxylesterase